MVLIFLNLIKTTCVWLEVFAEEPDLSMNRAIELQKKLEMRLIPSFQDLKDFSSLQIEQNLPLAIEHTKLFISNLEELKKILKHKPEWVNKIMTHFQQCEHFRLEFEKHFEDCVEDPIENHLHFEPLFCSIFSTPPVQLLQGDFKNFWIENHENFEAVIRFMQTEMESLMENPLIKDMLVLLNVKKSLMKLIDRKAVGTFAPIGLLNGWLTQLDRLEKDLPVREPVTSMIKRAIDHAKLRFRKEIDEIKKMFRAVQALRNRDNCPLHLKTTRERAEVLLQREPVGSYLVRQKEHNPWALTLSFHEKKGMIAHLDLPYGAEERLEEIVQKRSESKPLPLQDQPFSHLSAQLEWHVTSTSPEKELRSAREGDWCLTRGEGDNAYLLNVKCAEQSLRSYPLKVDEKGIWLQRDGTQVCALNLYTDVTRHLGLRYRDFAPYFNDYRIPIIEKLYYQRLLPEMLERGQVWAKASRQLYPFLLESVWVNLNGGICKQIHKKDFLYEGIRVQGSDHKGLMGKGTYKSVWKLRPWFAFDNQMVDMVRARLDPRWSPEANCQKISDLRADMGHHPHLLLPITVEYEKELLSPIVYTQIMPYMRGGNLFDAVLSKKLSYQGKLKAAYQIASALHDMHEKGWCHLDVKPENILLESNENKMPNVYLADFDLTRQINEEEIVHAGTLAYVDPLILQSQCKGHAMGAIADQFSFGTMLYFLFTGNLLVGRVFGSTSIRKESIERQYLSSPGFNSLDPRLQDIIVNCLVGMDRIDCLDQHAETLKDLHILSLPNIEGL